MLRLSTLRFLALLVLFVGFFNSSFAASQTIDWSYSGKTGPDYWGQINPDYKLCRLGKSQSPINIANAVPGKAHHLDIHYLKNHFLIKRTAINLYEYNNDPNQYVMLDNQKYQLQQIHFHTPSEHTLNHEKFAMEIHLVHKNSRGDALAIGLLVKLGKSNPYLDQLFSDKLPQVDNSKKSAHLLDPNQLIREDRGHYEYSGSLTTPPCVEPIHWFVMKTPIEISQKQLDFFQKNVIKFNARPLQPLNNRVIVE